jgi:phosphoglycolate phosphatase-like HAD superfamily hydrolase
LLHLVSQAGVVPEETVLVGDSIFDWRTAVAAGTRATLARYGFGFRTLSFDELDASVTLIDRPLDLIATL